MVASATKLSRAGAELAICPDNSLHQAYDLVVEKSPIPWLHMVEEVAVEARRRGYRCLGLLGTRQVMEGPVYGAKLSEQGIDHRVPLRDEQVHIDHIIFDELVQGQILETSRTFLARVLAGLSQRGCNAVVIGCTKLPLLLRAERSPLPLMDSKRLLARAALRMATGSALQWSAE
jgi:aspartate racemase